VNRWRVGEDRGSKETDGCPLTVKWKGYDKSHNQWEVHTQLHAKPKIVQFHCKNPGAAHDINAAIFNSIPFTRADLATSWQSLR
jgi:hypothetical protein